MAAPLPVGLLLAAVVGALSVDDSRREGGLGLGADEVSRFGEAEPLGLDEDGSAGVLISLFVRLASLVENIRVRRLVIEGFSCGLDWLGLV